MTKITSVALAVVTVSSVSAQPLTQGERDRALSELYVSRKLFLDSIAGLTPAQWSFKPAPDVWSIGECAEHIALSEDLMLDSLPRLMQAPAEPQKRAAVKGKDEFVLKAMLDRSHKAQAREVLIPKHRWADETSLVAHFKQSCDRTLDYIRTTNDDLRDHFIEHPVFKTVDAYQFILMMSAHTQRHTAQLNEVKQAPGYPK
jgi:hypothetical protein